jgi:hypothetical protein
MEAHFDIIFFQLYQHFCGSCCGKKIFVSRSAGGSWTPNKHGAANAWFLQEENKKNFRVCKRILFFRST